MSKTHPLGKALSALPNLVIRHSSFVISLNSVWYSPTDRSNNRIRGTPEKL